MLKLFSKYIVKHKRIPILGQVRVIDGHAQITDMDFYLTIPINADDGMYYPQAFEKSTRIKSDLPIDDFPQFKPEKSAIATTVLEPSTAQHLEWVGKASSNEESRYYLGGCFFDWSESDGFIVATDGHRIHTFKNTIEATRPKKIRKKIGEKFKMVVPQTGKILPKKAVRMLVDLMKHNSEKPAKISFYESTFIAKVGDAVLEGKLIDGTYPAWRRVIPSCPDKNKTIFNPEQIKAFMPEITTIAKIANQKKPSIRIQKGVAYTVDCVGIKRQWPITIDWDMSAGFNVKYLSELCGGVMEYIDPSSPFKVTDRREGIERMAVIMPLRV